MEKDIFDIIEEKDYNELTTAELSELSEFCASEEEFLQMKGVLVNVAGMKAAEPVAPKAEVKQKLDDLFVAQASVISTQDAAKPTMSVVARERKFYERPLFQVAAMIVVFLSILPFVLRKEIPTNNKQLAKYEVEKSKNVEEPKSIEKPVKADEPATAAQSEQTITREEAAPKRTTNFGPMVDAFPYKAEQDSYGEVPPQPAPMVPPKPESAIALFEEKEDVAAAKDVSPTVTSSATAPVEPFTHSDGVFAGAESDKLRFSKVVSQQPEVLDLLTASF